MGRRRLQLLVAVTVAAVAVLVLASPVQGWVLQRGDLADQEASLARLERENDRLERQRDRLSDPGEVQRIARRDYGLVGVGEESYTVLPPPTAGLVLPRGWPFDRIDDAIAVAASRP